MHLIIDNSYYHNCKTYTEISKNLFALNFRMFEDELKFLLGRLVVDDITCVIIDFLRYPDFHVHLSNGQELRGRFDASGGACFVRDTIYGKHTFYELRVHLRENELEIVTPTRVQVTLPEKSFFSGVVFFFNG